MMKLETTLVHTDTPLRDVICVINQNKMQIALVVDQHKTLLGTVTDGDIRRGILRGVTLEDCAEAVMNKKPSTATDTESREALLDKMTRNGFRHMPVVNKQGQVIRLETLEELLRPQSKDNWVVLMAGGRGQRLGILTDDCPKPLLKVGNKPLLETILKNFIRHGFKNFYITVNYKAEMIQEYFGDGSTWSVNIRYLSENQRMGTAGALGLISDPGSLPIIVMNGDLLTKVNFSQLLEFHEEQKAKFTMCLREYDFQVPYGVVKTDSHQITSIDEKPIQKFFVNAGIYVLDPDVLQFVPKDKVFDMPSLVDKLLEKKYSTTAFPLREYWLDVGRLSDFERANGEFSSEFDLGDEE